ncbi:MAG: hypothetical protein E4H38_00890 [Gemmatimonadales bacterium]|nr:MAG: hypothetical protein E4H38_00890 [Gemmatimonadales bacterium]
MRVTKVDSCGNIVVGPGNMVVTDGFVSIAFSPETNEAEAIVVTNANGKTCAKDDGCPETTGFGVELTFCEVTPCLFSIITGQPVVENADGEAVGFKMSTRTNACDSAFALEVWSGVPGVACGGGGGGSYGYILLPNLRAGTIGDFSVENAAISFVISGAMTQSTNGWGSGPYDVVGDATDMPSVLPDPLDPEDYLYLSWTSIEPPPNTDGCEDMVLPT